MVETSVKMARKRWKYMMVDCRTRNVDIAQHSRGARVGCEHKCEEQRAGKERNRNSQYTRVGC